VKPVADTSATGSSQNFCQCAIVLHMDVRGFAGLVTPKEKSIWADNGNSGHL
jgi:hypothetical protein